MILKHIQKVLGIQIMILKQQIHTLMMNMKMTKKSANAQKNVRQWKMNYKKIHNQHKHQNLTLKHIHSLAVIRAMVEANRTTGTVDNVRDL
jgi:hypothetical protein